VVRKLPERARLATPALPRRPDRVVAPVVELRPDAVASPAPAPVPSGVVQPLARARYKVQFTASAELYDKLQRLQVLMRGAVPDGDLAVIIEQAVTEKLERFEPGDSRRRALPGKRCRRPIPPPPRATSRLPSGAPCTSATETDAATWTSRAGDAPSATTAGRRWLGTGVQGIESPRRRASTRRGARSLQLDTRADRRSLRRSRP
jgi:hypothetical protein